LARSPTKANRTGLSAVLVQLVEGTSADARDATQRLEAVMAIGGPLADYLHLLMASAAVRTGDLAKAQRYYEIAFERNEAAPVLANNLAYVLARADPPQLERALELVDRALRKQPDDPRFRGTRGQIAVMQKRSKEAIVDLELALQKSSGNAELHQSLADAYDAVGEKSLAQRHRQLAARKR